jgi:phosphoribosylglycinamide formyltransferase-1
MGEAEVLPDQLAESLPAEEGDRLRLGVLASGSGSNLQAIMDRCDEGLLSAEVSVVIADAEDAYALVRARAVGIPAIHIGREEYPDASAFNAAIRDQLLDHAVGLVVMAGYMRLLGAEVLDAFPNRVMNVHPALLPSFAGAHGIADAFAHGVKVSGVTVHFADEVFDRGPIIAQEALRIEETDTPESLEARIHAVEHRILPEAIQLFAEGRLVIDGRRVRVLPEA